MLFIVFLNCHDSVRWEPFSCQFSRIRKLRPREIKVACPKLYHYGPRTELRHFGMLDHYTSPCHLISLRGWQKFLCSKTSKISIFFFNTDNVPGTMPCALFIYLVPHLYNCFRAFMDKETETQKI